MSIRHSRICRDSIRSPCLCLYYFFLAHYCISWRSGIVPCASSHIYLEPCFIWIIGDSFVLLGCSRHDCIRSCLNTEVINSLLLFECSFTNGCGSWRPTVFSVSHLLHEEVAGARVWYIWFSLFWTNRRALNVNLRRLFYCFLSFRLICLLSIGISKWRRFPIFKRWVKHHFRRTNRRWWHNKWRSFFDLPLHLLWFTKFYTRPLMFFWLIVIKLLWLIRCLITYSAH